MTITTATLREKVARKLRVQTADTTLEADDADIIDDGIEEATNYLREKGLAWWADNAIPDAAVMPMVLVVSAWVCTDFGKAGQGYEQGFEGGQMQLASIKPSAVVETVRAKYY